MFTIRCIEMIYSVATPAWEGDPKGSTVKRSDVLALAILGTLEGGPLHGYEIRKRLGTELGPFRSLSYGSLYPALRSLTGQGLIEETSAAPRPASRRSRISYVITDAGHAALAKALSDSGAASGDDEQFGVRFTLFGRTDRATRLHVMEARRLRLRDRMESARALVASAEKAGDTYMTEFRRHTLDGIVSEIEWLDHVIERERSSDRGDAASDAHIT